MEEIRKIIKNENEVISSIEIKEPAECKSTSSSVVINKECITLQMQ